MDLSEERVEIKTMRLSPLSCLLSFFLLTLFVSFSGFAQLGLLFISLIPCSIFLHVKLLRSIGKNWGIIAIALIMFSFGCLGVKGPHYALLISLRFLYIALSYLIFLHETPAWELSNGISKMLSPILGVKAWRLSSSLYTSMRLFRRLLPLLRETLIAFRARGGNFHRPIKSLSLILIAFMRRASSYTADLEEGMASRFFNPSTPRTPTRIKREDILFLICIATLSFAAFIIERFF